MKSTRTIVTAACVLMVALSWVAALTSRTVAEKQLSLIMQAETLISDEIYVLAVPLLEEAAGYEAVYTTQAEEKLKRVYLALINNRGYARKYTTLLNKQMARQDAASGIFYEAARYYLSTGAKQEALSVMRAGVSKTSCAELIQLYESERYAYKTDRGIYEDVTAIYNRALQVKQNGMWGIVNTDGSILIPCMYEKISNFDRGQAVVQNDGIIFAVDRENNRIALAPDETSDFRNYADNRTSLLTNAGWKRATGEFNLGVSVFDDIGMYANGYAAAKANGRWGVVDIDNNWLIPAQYDEIIMDELGQCYGQEVVFARTGGTVYMFRGGALLPATFQDARPFATEGYAAVCIDDKWGFVDTDGSYVIKPVFDNALSFSGHLAAVKTNGFWGYINTKGTLVIDAQFLEAGSFSHGSAPVFTEKGWQLITLIEFKDGKIE